MTSLILSLIFLYTKTCKEPAPPTDDTEHRQQLIVVKSIDELTDEEYELLHALQRTIYEGTFFSLNTFCSFVEKQLYFMPTIDGRYGDKLKKPLSLIAYQCDDRQILNPENVDYIAMIMHMLSVSTDSGKGRNIHLQIERGFIHRESGYIGSIEDNPLFSFINVVTIVPTHIRIIERFDHLAWQ